MYPQGHNITFTLRFACHANPAAMVTMKLPGTHDCERGGARSKRTDMAGVGGGECPREGGRNRAKNG